MIEISVWVDRLAILVAREDGTFVTFGTVDELVSRCGGDRTGMGVF